MRSVYYLPPASDSSLTIQARVERLVTRLDPQLTRAAYRHWLTILWGFYAPLEARLEAGAAALPADWPRDRYHVAHLPGPSDGGGNNRDRDHRDTARRRCDLRRARAVTARQVRRP